MKKQQFYRKLFLICILGCAISTNIIHTDDDDFFDSFNLDSDIESVGPTRLYIDPATLGIDPENYTRWFNLLLATDIFDPTSAIKVKNLILTDFFLQSNRLVTRNINNYPFALHFDYSISEQDTFTTNVFLNKCTSKYLTSTGNSLESIVNFDNQGLEDVLATIDLLTGGILAEASSLDLFAPGRIEERKLGGLFQYMRRNENWFFRAQLPFMYIERNLQFTQEQKDAIYNSTLTQIIAHFSAGNSPSTETTEDVLASQHFIVDQIGFGNVHLGAMHNLIDTHNFTLKLGEYIEFPTEWAFKQGVKGTWFPQDNSNRFPLVMAAIDPTLPVSLTTPQQDMLAAFFLGSVDQMSANVLTTSLGNNKHTAIAIQTDFAWYPFEKIYFQGYGAMQYMLPCHEQRFFIKQAGNKYTNFVASVPVVPLPDPGPPTSQAIAVVDGFAQELQDRLYPYVYTTTVQPGIMFNLFASVEIPYHKWHFSAGANGWYQAQETLFNIDGPSTIVGLIDLTKARGFTAYQVKPFVKMDYHCDHNNLTIFSLYGDYTVANEATGNDFTINLQFIMKF